MSGQVQPSGTFPQLGQVVKKGDILAYLSPRLGGDTDLASLQTNARKASVALDLTARARARREGIFNDVDLPQKRALAALAAEADPRTVPDAPHGPRGPGGSP